MKIYLEGVKTLEYKILSFDSWEQPWTFFEFVNNDKMLNESDLNLFDEICKKGGNYKLWNGFDLVLGCKASHSFIAENYNLSDKAIANIVRVLAYAWK